METTGYQRFQDCGLSAIECCRHRAELTNKGNGVCCVQDDRAGVVESQILWCSKDSTAGPDV